MVKRVAKPDLPTKICPACLRPFAWRKKWSKVWDDVRYCSEACRRLRRSTPGGMADRRDE